MEELMRMFLEAAAVLILSSSVALGCECNAKGVPFHYVTVNEDDVDWMEEHYWDVQSFQLDASGTCVVRVNLIAGDHPAIDTLVLDQPGEDNWDDQIFWGEWMLTDTFEAQVVAQGCAAQTS
jgi:hypothetical protein